MKKILIIVGVLALLAALAVPMAVFADVGTTEITANVTSQFTFQVPAAIALGDLDLGWNNGYSEPGGYCATNDPGGLKLTVESNHILGKMISGGNVLNEPLLVNTGNTTVHLGTLPPTEPDGVAVTTVAQDVLGVNAPMYSEIQLVVFQNIGIADPVAEDYSIILTYTMTVPYPP
jgi:hypothetical protein